MPPLAQALLALPALPALPTAAVVAAAAVATAQAAFTPVVASLSSALISGRRKQPLPRQDEWAAHRAPMTAPATALAPAEAVCAALRAALRAWVSRVGHRDLERPVSCTQRQSR